MSDRQIRWIENIIRVLVIIGLFYAGTAYYDAKQTALEVKKSCNPASPGIEGFEGVKLQDRPVETNDSGADESVEKVDSKERSSSE